MLIIIEGTDFLGKTKLAKELAAHFSLKYQHSDRPDKDFDFANGYPKLLVGNQVFDRFHVGTLVYGTALGKYTHGFDKCAQDRLALEFRRHNTLQITMFDSEVNLRKRLEHNDREEMYNTEDILTANFAFKCEAATPLTPHHFAYDIAGGWKSLSQLLKEIRVATGWRNELDQIDRIASITNEHCHRRHVVSIAFDRYGERLQYAVNGDGLSKCKGTPPCGCTHSEQRLIQSMSMSDYLHAHTIAITHSPCIKCAEAILEADCFERVVYAEPYENDLAGLELLKQTPNIEVVTW